MNKLFLAGMVILGVYADPAPVPMPEVPSVKEEVKQKVEEKAKPSSTVGKESRADRMQAIIEGWNAMVKDDVATFNALLEKYPDLLDELQTFARAQHPQHLKKITDLNAAYSVGKEHGVQWLKEKASGWELIKYHWKEYALVAVGTAAVIGVSYLLLRDTSGINTSQFVTHAQMKDAVAITGPQMVQALSLNEVREYLQESFCGQDVLAGYVTHAALKKLLDESIIEIDPAKLAEALQSDAARKVIIEIADTAAKIVTE